MRTKIIALILVFSITTLIGGATAYTEGDPLVTDLIAGQHIDAGDVIAWDDGSSLFVKYVTQGGWRITETHLHVSKSPDDIPQKNGNPIPGQFDYKTEHDPSVTEYTYTVPLPTGWEPGDGLYIAAHAVVKSGECTEEGLAGLEATLPSQVTIDVDSGSPLSYLEVTISGGTILDGIHQGWCIDTDHGIGEEVSYMANVYSSYGTIPTDLIEHPENLDLVNWIINQDYVGKTSGCGGGELYTYGDVQRAIWELLDDEQASPGNLGPWSNCRVNEILAAAAANGEGYEPSQPGELLVVILEPYERDVLKQVLIIAIPIPPCEEGEETAWGDGPGFPGRNWATYITYDEETEIETEPEIVPATTPEPPEPPKPPKPLPPQAKGKAKGRKK